MLDPVFPMEPKSSRTIMSTAEWISQIKWDGVRILTYVDRDRVQLFNRRKHERTHHYPELGVPGTYCNASSAVFDGEMIALGSDGKPSFHKVMKRDAIRRLERVAMTLKAIPVSYMIFDLLYLNGKWLTKLPLKERLELLSSTIQPSETVQLVSLHEDAQTLFDVMKQHRMEGIVQKRLDSPYRLNDKSGEWLKVKNFRDVIATVGGFTLNTSGVINALLLGLFDEQKNLFYIGHVGTGKLSHQDWVHLTRLLLPSAVERPLFNNLPGRRSDAVWVRPTLSVKIQYVEWTNGMTLRQPTIQAFVDVPVHECLLSQT